MLKYNNIIRIKKNIFCLVQNIKCMQELRFKYKIYPFDKLLIEPVEY